MAEKQAQIEQLQAAVDSASDSAAQIESLNQQLAEKQAQIEQLQATVDNLGENGAQIEALNQQLTEYQDQITSLQKQLDEAHSDEYIQQLEQQISNLEAQLIALGIPIPAQVENVEELEESVDPAA